MQSMSDSTSVVLRVEGVVDPDRVGSLRERVDELRGVTACVVIDLSEARGVHHLALAMLADDVAKRRAPAIVLRGLCEHHLRMLRYFGKGELVSEPPARQRLSLADA
jgi:hypothetical protein